MNGLSLTHRQVQPGRPDSSLALAQLFRTEFSVVCKGRGWTYLRTDIDQQAANGR